MMKGIYLRRTRAVVLGLMLGVAAATVSSPAPAQGLTKVQMAHAVALFRLPLYVAIHNGYFKEQGIDLQLVSVASGANAMKMLAGGSVEFSTGQLVDAINLNLQEINIRGVFMLTSRYTNSLLVVKGLENEIKSLADLKGRPLGVTGVGSGTWQFAMFIARKEGVNPDTLNVVGVGAGANVTGAVRSKRVAVMSYAEPESLQLVADGDASMMVDMGEPATHDKFIGPDYMNNWLMVLKEYADKNPDIVQRFTNALQQGLAWAREHSPKEIAALLRQVDGFKTMDQNVLEAAVKRQGIPRSGVVTKSAFENAINVPRVIGALKKEFALEDLTINKFAEAAAAKYPSKQ